MTGDVIISKLPAASVEHLGPDVGILNIIEKTFRMGSLFSQTCYRWQFESKTQISGGLFHDSKTACLENAKTCGITFQNKTKFGKVLGDDNEYD